MGATRGFPPYPALPPSLSPPDMVQQRLALVMVLLEPGPELGGGDHEQRVAGSAQRCLQQRERCFSGNGVEWEEACVCHPRKHKEQYSPVDSPEHALSVAGCSTSPGRRREHNQPRADPTSLPRQDPGTPACSPWSPSATPLRCLPPGCRPPLATGGSKQLPGQRRP